MDSSPYLTVNQLAQLLSLNPQTVYRKCRKGQIPCIRVGKTIRFDPDQIAAIRTDGSPEITPSPRGGAKRGAAVPSFMHHLFWDVDASTLTAADRIVVERVLEHGDLADVRWLLTHTSLEKLRDFVKRYGHKRLTRKSLYFWRGILGVKNALQSPAGNATETLAETGWR